MDASSRVAIVGASAAGLTAAETLRRAKFEGAITLIGGETELPYDRPPLSKRVLSGEWHPAQTALRSRADIDGLGLTLRLGVRAEALSVQARTVELSDGTSEPFDGLIIASGARARTLFEPNPAVHALRTLDDAVRLRARLTACRRLVIVGAGLIGAEAAAVARGLGVRVTLVEPNAAPLEPVAGRLVGSFLAQAHRDRGVDLRLGTSVRGPRFSRGELTGVTLSTGEVVPADDVLVAVGSVPNTEWLVGSGLGLDNGVECDEFCAAGPGIYAAGDVARWHNRLFGCDMRIEHRTNAGEQAMVAARNLLRQDSERVSFATVPYFWSDQYDVRLQSYGYLRGHDEERLVAGSLATGAFVVAFRRGERLAGIVSAGLAPRELRQWRQGLAQGAAWEHVAVLARESRAA